MHEESPLSEVFVGEKVNDFEALLVQLPGTLPFEGLEPHDGKGLYHLLESGALSGKLRVHKSGKVTMRLVSKEGAYVDFDLNRGIEANFY